MKNRQYPIPNGYSLLCLYKDVDVIQLKPIIIYNKGYRFFDDFVNQHFGIDHIGNNQCIVFEKKDTQRYIAISIKDGNVLIGTDIKFTNMVADIVLPKEFGELCQNLDKHNKERR